MRPPGQGWTIELEHAKITRIRMLAQASGVTDPHTSRWTEEARYAQDPALIAKRGDQPR
jgi:hypothetical protein